MEEEKKECKCKCKGLKVNKFVYWFAVIVGVSFIVYASIGIGNKLANDTCNCPSCDKEESIKTASKDKYEFDFYDGAIPGGRYTGFIDLKSGLVKVVYEQGCSVPNTCTIEPEVTEGNLSNASLNKVIDYLEKNKYPTVETNIPTDKADKDLRTNLSNLIYYVMLEAEGNKNISLATSGFDNLLK